jgi:hypothetical protein
VVKISTQGVATLALYLKALRTKPVKIVLCKIEYPLGIVATRKNHTLVNLDYLVLKAHNITSLLYFTTFSNFSQQKSERFSARFLFVIEFALMLWKLVAWQEAS